jgi:uncharacterized Zn-finger protein
VEQPVFTVGFFRHPEVNIELASSLSSMRCQYCGGLVANCPA